MSLLARLEGARHSKDIDLTRRKSTDLVEAVQALREGAGLAGNGFRPASG